MMLNKSVLQNQTKYVEERKRVYRIVKLVMKIKKIKKEKKTEFSKDAKEGKTEARHSIKTLNCPPPPTPPPSPQIFSPLLRVEKFRRFLPCKLNICSRNNPRESRGQRRWSRIIQTTRLSPIYAEGWVFKANPNQRTVDANMNLLLRSFAEGVKSQKGRNSLAETEFIRESRTDFTGDDGT